jgi:hypothetical protein
MTITIGSARWQVWLQRERVELWEAVCLSLNLDPKPDTINLRKRDCAPDDPLYFYARDFKDRLLTAERSLGANGGLKSFSTVIDDPARALGTLPAFGTWAERLKWDLPDKFPRENEDAVVANSWPWGTRETKLLKNMAAAADRFWKLYDPTDRTTAPLSEDVQAWLEAEGVGNRVAEAMAQILRADGLPSGRRPK